MIGILLLVLVIGALIAVIFGRKAAQGFVGFAVGVLLILVAGFGYLLYKLDKIGGHEPYPGEAVTPSTSDAGGSASQNVQGSYSAQAINGRYLTIRVVGSVASLRGPNGVGIDNMTVLQHGTILEFEGGVWLQDGYQISNPKTDLVGNVAYLSSDGRSMTIHFYDADWQLAKE